jgi:hypothetical protein
METKFAFRVSHLHPPRCGGQAGFAPEPDQVSAQPLAVEAASLIEKETSTFDILWFCGSLFGFAESHTRLYSAPSAFCLMSSFQGKLANCDVFSFNLLSCDSGCVSTGVRDLHLI